MLVRFGLPVIKVSALHETNFQRYPIFVDVQEFAFRLHRIVRSPVSIIATVILLIIFTYFELSQRNDFDVFLQASNGLFNGRPIFTDKYFGCYHYYYSTLFATLIYPLALLPLLPAKLIWILLNLALVVRIWNLILQELRSPGFNKYLQTLLGVVMLFISLRFLRANIHFGQVTLLILWATMEGLSLIRKDKKAAGGALLAFAINVKILPVVFWPYLLWRKEFRALTLSIAAWIAMMFIPALWLGYARQTTLITEWWSIVNPTLPGHIIDTSETSFHSLTALVPTLFMEPEDGDRQMTYRFARLSASQASSVILFARLCLIAMTIWFLRLPPFRKSQGEKHAFWEMSYLLLVIPLIFPHQQHYAFLLALPAITWILFSWLSLWQETKRRPDVLSMVTMGIIVTCFNLSLWLGAFTAWYNHFKIITWASLLVIPLLAINAPFRKQG